MLTLGTRVRGKGPHELQPGEYVRWLDADADDDGAWYAHCPGPGHLVANLARHTIMEHDDGTITVVPSILCGNGSAGNKWHGFLERGVWREC